MYYYTLPSLNLINLLNSKRLSSFNNNILSIIDYKKDFHYQC